MGWTWPNVLCLPLCLRSSGLRPFSTELRKPCRARLCGREHVGRVRERTRMVEKRRYPNCGRGPVVTLSGLSNRPLSKPGFEAALPGAAETSEGFTTARVERLQPGRNCVDVL